MSTVQEFWISGSQPFHTPAVPVPAASTPATTNGSSSSDRRLHRIAEVRRSQGVSVRSAARRMHTSMEQVRKQEDPQADLSLSDLYHWHEALEVPVTDLLVENDSPLSEPILARARLLRVMKTVRAMKETATAVSILRFVSMLEQQLVELMPELQDVAAWHSVGRRRSPDEMGRTAERVVSDTFFMDAGD